MQIIFSSSNIAVNEIQQNTNSRITLFSYGQRYMNKSSIKANAVLNTLKTVLGILFPLITFPYVSRVLQVETVGIYNFCTSIISYFVLFAGLGISSYAIREGAQYRYNPEKFERFTSEVFTINLYSTILSYAFLGLSIALMPKLHIYSIVISILSMQMAFNLIGVQWVCNIYEDFLAITVRTIITQIISLIAIFLFVKSPNDLYLYSGIVTFANGGANIFNFFYIRKKYTKFKITAHCNFKKHIKPILILFSTSLTIVIYVSSDSTMLGFMTTNYQVGLYGTSVRIYTVIKNVLSAILTVMIPRFSILLNKKDKSEAESLFSRAFNTMTLMAVPAVIGLCLCSEEVILLLAGPTYVEATRSLQILSIATIFSLYAYLFTQCILVPAKKEKYAFRATLISAIVNVGLNFIFIPYLGINGAAITTIIAELLTCIIAYVYSAKEIKFIDLKKNLITCSISSLGVVACCIISRHLIANNYIRIPVAIISSVITYVLMLMLCRNTIAINAISTIKKKIIR